jgi:hypothetical protein
VPRTSRILAEDALLSMLFPLWQLVIGVCVVLVVALSARRLARRGPSRMTTAVIVSGAAVLGITALGLLLNGR